MLQHVLDDIVAILIGGKRQSREQDLTADECLHIFQGAMFKHPLNYPAAIGVGGETHHTALDVLRTYETG